MSMSLREEIYDVCSSHTFLWGTEMTDKILKLFEKRIDDKINEVEHSYNSSKETFHSHEIRSSKIQILKEFKQEILK